MLFFSFAGGVFTLLTIALAYPICRFIMHEPSALWCVIMISPCIIIGSIASVERGYFEGLRNMTPTAANEVLEGIFKIIFGLFFAYKALAIANQSYAESGKVFGKSCADAASAADVALPLVAAGAVLGVTAANCLALIIILIADKIKGDGISREMIIADKSSERMRGLLWRLIKLCLPIAVSSLITTLTSMVDLITINSCLTKAIAVDGDFFLRQFDKAIAGGENLKTLPGFIYGSYAGLAVTVFSLIPSLTAMFAKSSIPLVAENYATNSKIALEKNIGAVLFATSIIILPSALGIFTFSEEILTLLFSRREAEIAACVSVLRIMSPGIIFSALALPLLSVLQGIGKANIPVMIMLCGCILKLVVNILTIKIPKINILGAGISTVICYFTIFMLSLYFVIKQTGVDISFKKLFYKPFAAALLCIFTARYAFDLLILRVNLVFALLTAIFLGGIIYIFALYLLSVLNKNELKTLFLK